MGTSWSDALAAIAAPLWARYIGLSCRSPSGRRPFPSTTTLERMTWEPELEEIRRRTELAKQMGGTERVQRQHDQGRLTVRERLELLLDKDSFHEIGAL